MEADTIQTVIMNVNRFISELLGKNFPKTSIYFNLIYKLLSIGWHRY